MKINLIKTISGLLPADPDSEESYKKIKTGSMVETETKEVRNPAFLRKYFALINIGYDNWVPPKVSSIYGVPEKNYKKFRDDVTILAGYFHIVIRLDGSTQIVADSISFANMVEETFGKLYNATITVLLKRVYNDTLSKEDLDNIVNSYMSFT